MLVQLVWGKYNHRLAPEPLDQPRPVLPAWGCSSWWSLLPVFHITTSRALPCAGNRETEFPEEHFVSPLSILKLLLSLLLGVNITCKITEKKKKPNKTFLKQSGWYQNVICKTLHVIKLQDILQHLVSQCISTYEIKKASQLDPYVRNKHFWANTVSILQRIL